MMTALDEEIRVLFAAQVRRLAAQSFTLDRSRSNVAVCPPAEWATFAENGLFALGIHPAQGGLGGEASDWGMVMRELGRTLSPLPYLDATIVASRVITLATSGSRQTELLKGIAEGSVRLAFAHSEAGAGNDRAFVETRFDGENLIGRKTNVLDAENADSLLVTARGEGDALVIALVARDAEGVGLHGYRLPDNRRAARVEFSTVPAELVGQLSPTELEEVLDLAAACLAADSVGASEAVNSLTLEYAKTRKQFGQPIGHFQAIQHRLVDMYIAQRAAAAVVEEALASLDEGGANAAALCSAAKAYADRASFEIAQGAIQIHGGMGLTDECAAGHYLKRIMVNASLHGTADWHVRRAATDQMSSPLRTNLR